MIKTKVILPLTIVILTVVWGNVPAPVAAVPVSVDETQGEAAQIDTKRETNDAPSVNSQVAEDTAGVEPNPQQKRGSSGYGDPHTGRSMKRRRPVSSSSSSSSSSEEIVHHPRSRSSHAHHARSSRHQSHIISSSSESDEHGPRIHRKLHHKGRQFFYPHTVPVVKAVGPMVQGGAKAPGHRGKGAS